MDALGAGLVLFLNGLLQLLSGLVGWSTLLVLVSGASLFWLAGIEVEDLNRQGIKPDVMRH